jgi:hypothetical protein
MIPITLRDMLRSPSHAVWPGSPAKALSWRKARRRREASQSVRGKPRLVSFVRDDHDRNMTLVAAETPIITGGNDGAGPKSNEGRAESLP